MTKPQTTINVTIKNNSGIDSWYWSFAPSEASAQQAQLKGTPAVRPVPYEGGAIYGQSIPTESPLIPRRWVLFCPITQKILEVCPTCPFYNNSNLNWRGKSAYWGVCQIKADLQID